MLLMGMSQSFSHLGWNYHHPWAHLIPPFLTLSILTVVVMVIMVVMVMVKMVRVVMIIMIIIMLRT